jgi:alkylation response protein AidB-like acyl-CoA dehydrogenase
VQLLIGEAGRSATVVLRTMLERERPEAGWPHAGLSESSRARLWARITADSWHLLGVPAAAGGGGATLVDLLAVAELWGGHLMPLPLLETMVLRRWVGDEVDAGARLTWVAANGLIPFASDPKVTVVQSVDPLRTLTLRSAVSGSVDEFAPSMPLGTARTRGHLSASCIHELETMAVASAVGAAAAALETTVAYTKDRQAFGRPIGQFQAVKHRLANMHIDVELARTAVTWAVQDAASGRAALPVALERTQRAVAGAIQMHGGMGFTWEMGIHFYMRHVLAVDRLLRSRGAGGDGRRTPDQFEQGSRQ